MFKTWKYYEITQSVTIDLKEKEKKPPKYSKLGNSFQIKNYKLGCQRDHEEPAKETERELCRLWETGIIQFPRREGMFNYVIANNGSER